jgi:hypothetical protein
MWSWNNRFSSNLESGEVRVFCASKKKPHDNDLMLLNGVWHEIFDFRFFHEHPFEVISIFAVLGSGAFLTPGSGIRIRFFPDLGSRIPNPYFWGLGDNFLSENFNNSWKIGPNLFLQHIKNKIIFSFVKFVATKNGLTKKKFSPLSFVAVFGSGIRDPGSGMGRNQDPGSGINIPDPPHWIFYKNKFVMNTFSSPTLSLAHFCVGSIFFVDKKRN